MPKNQKPKRQKPKSTAIAIWEPTKEIFEEAERRDGTGSLVKLLDKTARKLANDYKIPIRETNEGCAALER